MNHAHCLLLLISIALVTGCSAKHQSLHQGSAPDAAYPVMPEAAVIGGAPGYYPKSLAPGVKMAERERLKLQEEAFACRYIVYPPVLFPGNTERYAEIDENPFEPVQARPLSTFSIDVDTGAYSNIRRYLTEGQLPPRDAVRIEELVNYFDYDYAPPTGADPFAVHLQALTCPWAPQHRLVHIGLKGKEVETAERPHSNLVFLVDVSGSMMSDDKLPLLVRGMKLLTRQLDERDTVGIVTYAGHSGVALEPTRCTPEGRRKILRLLDRLEAGGSTHGSAGIQEAYALARENFLEDGTNRVILCSDGDFNVGTTNLEELVGLITAKAKTGVFLTVLGFGQGNLKDETMEQLANKGNGIYGYVDNLSEARKLLVSQMTGSLVTIAKDVKIQVEFNPAEVAAWRLIGYENRLLADEDFNDDTKDAGEIGAGHTVTALYEVVPVGVPLPQNRTVDPLKYQQTKEQPLELTAAAQSGELMTVKLRYKQPEGDTSTLISAPLPVSETSLEDAGTDARFAAAVAAFGMLLRDSQHIADEFSFESVEQMAQGARGKDESGYRAEFVNLVRNARDLS